MKDLTKKRGKKMFGAFAAVAMASALGMTAFAPPHMLKADALSANAEAASKGWMPDFESLEEEHELAAELNLQLMEEGMVLLKNKDNALPLKANERNVTLFGTRSYLPFYSGSGSGGKHGNIMVDQQYDGTEVTLVESFENAGFRLNTKVKNIYDNIGSQYAAGIHSNGKIRVEAPVHLLTSAKGSYYQYGDAAITTISRVGGEDNDMSLTDPNGVMFKDPTHQELQLDDNEKALIKEMGENFGKVIVLINSGNVMELGDLEDDPNVSAVLWVGQPGQNGFKAIPRILTGAVNPSGKTVDIYPADLEADPTWNNYGNFTVRKMKFEEDGVTPALNANGAYTFQNFSAVKTVEYEEGIYYGYKWYETAAADGALTTLDTYDKDMKGLYPAGVTDQYYNRSNGVVYPFGHGLSYTTFKQELVTKAADLTAAINAASGLDTKVQVKVKVTNTGDVKGKEVVQLYAHAPYTKGGIEKSEVVFVGFAKTKELLPDQSEIVTVDVRLGDLASFDYEDKNNNGYKGYEIEAGSYEIRLQSDSHNVIDKLTCALTAKTTALDNDADATNNTLFSNGDVYDTKLNVKDRDANTPADAGATMTTMSRNDFKGTYPTKPVNTDLYYSDTVRTLLSDSNTEAGNTENGNLGRFHGYSNGDNDETTDPWYVTSVPEGWTQAADTTGRTNGKVDILLGKMIGLDYWDDTTIVSTEEGHVFKDKTHAQAWEMFMNQLTWDEMIKLISDGGYGTIELASIDKDKSRDADGPGMLAEDGYFWCSSVNIASTYNTELAYRQGVMIGNESLLMNIPGWYGPGANIHRTAFCGRNFEYYSQDPVQGGLVASAVIRGAASKGVNSYVKHFGFNEQEINRNGLGTFVDEQSLRENYFKVFEYIAKESNTTGFMLAFGRTGAISAQVNYAQNTALARDEWGFKGVLITDGYMHNLGGANMMQRAGCDFPLGKYGGEDSISGTWNATLRGGKGGVADGAESTESATQYKVVRDSATRLLWMSANSNICESAIPNSAFTDKTFDLIEGIPMMSGGVFIASVGTELPEGVFATYGITEGRLPLGMGFDEVTGNFTDIPQESGTFEVTVAMYVNGWSKKTAKVTMNLEPLVFFDKTITMNLGDTFTSELTTNKKLYGVGGEYRQDDPIVSFELNYQGGLPEGDVPTVTYKTYSGTAADFATKFGYTWADTPSDNITGNEGATLTYTPTKPGVYQAVFQYRYLRYTGRWSSRTVRYTFVVEGEADPGNGKGIVSIEKTKTEGLKDTYTITYDDGSTYDFVITNGATGAQGAQGEQGMQGIRGPQGVQGETGETGAAGANGENGADGTNGTTPTIAISEDGFWVINGVKSDVKAVGTDGAAGAKGDKGDKGDTGAAGKDGENGANGGCGSSMSANGTVGALALAGVVALAALAAVRFTRKSKETK